MYNCDKNFNRWEWWLSLQFYRLLNLSAKFQQRAKDFAKILEWYKRWGASSEYGAWTDRLAQTKRIVSLVRTTDRVSWGQYSSFESRCRIASVSHKNVVQRRKGSENKGTCLQLTATPISINQHVMSHWHRGSHWAERTLGGGILPLVIVYINPSGEKYAWA